LQAFTIFSISDPSVVTESWISEKLD